MRLLRYCVKCKTYTLEEKCKVCGRDTITKGPARFSPQDRYGRYRLALKKLKRLEENGGGNR
ncbi:MAG TPA: RNA-protein complex protein Nop10 [Thermococcus sp.]|nr:RNA-protein complex protein Nop10 [Thermoplasmata archaeon]HDH43877.1 RNA-protein complex protein Nop10 [Thermococcus sp.]